MKAPRTLLGQGVLAGTAGAATLAAWFLVLYLRQGQAFRTPELLASILGFGDLQGGAVSVLVYTVVHFALFALVGIAATALVRQLDAVPGLEFGLVLGFLLFNLVFYGSVIVTGVEVVGELGGWPRVLAGNLLAGVAIFAALTAMGAAEPLRITEVLERHYTIREGLVTGLLGASAVALWFLIVDVIAGRILFTPAALGSAVFLGARTADVVQVSLLTVGGYTLLHVTAFMLTGLVAAGVVAAAEEYSEAILLGGVLLFVSFEAFSIGLLTIVANWLVDTLSWWNIAGANLVAAAAMGGYLYLRHPLLMRDVRERELEEDLVNDVPAPGHAVPGHAVPDAAVPTAAPVRSQVVPPRESD
jgi:hypothetical protein